MHAAGEVEVIDADGFSKEEAALFDAADVGARNAVFEVVDFGEEHEVEGEPGLDDELLGGDRDHQAIAGSADHGEEVLVGKAGGVAFIEDRILGFAGEDGLAAAFTEDDGGGDPEEDPAEGAQEGEMGVMLDEVW